jgi:hypothetical protein
MADEMNRPDDEPAKPDQGLPPEPDAVALALRPVSRASLGFNDAVNRLEAS